MKIEKLESLNLFWPTKSEAKKGFLRGREVKILSSNTKLYGSLLATIGLSTAIHLIASEHFFKKFGVQKLERDTFTILD